MWAVMFEIEKGEYVFDTGKDVFTEKDLPLYFNNKEDAQKHSHKWNTGVVVPYIKPMTEEERKSSKKRRGY